MNSEVVSNYSAIPASSKTIRHHETHHSDVSGPLLNETMEKYFEDNQKPSTEDPSTKILKNFSNDPVFKEDLDNLLQQLSKLKTQRDQYQAMLDQMALRFEGIEGGKQAYDKFLKEYIKENDELEGKSIDTQYGKDISNYLDKLNVQIDFLRLKIMDENSINIGIKEEAEFMPSKDFSRILMEEVNKKKELTSGIYSTNELVFKKKNRPKWISMDYRGVRFEKREDLDGFLDISRKSLEELQNKLGYFPQRIKDLEDENHRMMRLISKFNEIEANNSGTIKELKERLNSNDRKKDEMETFLQDLQEKQRQIEEKTRLLEEKSKKLEEKEKEIDDKRKELECNKNSEENEICENTNKNEEKSEKHEKNKYDDIQLHYHRNSMKPNPNENSMTRMPKPITHRETKDLEQKKLPLCSGCNIY